MLLTQEEAERVAAKVKAVEEHTAGELVVAVARQSDDYAGYRALLTAALTIALPLLVHELSPWTPPLWLFAAQVPLGLFLYWLLARPALLRIVVPKPAQLTQVENRALQVFMERGVAATRDRSGVLIYISEAERRVQILADSGIQARVGETEWSDDVALIIAGIREGEAARGILQAVERIGEILASAFPPRPDDENELPNEVVRVE